MSQPIRDTNLHVIPCTVPKHDKHGGCLLWEDTWSSTPNVKEGCHSLVLTPDKLHGQYKSASVIHYKVTAANPRVVDPTSSKQVRRAWTHLEQAHSYKHPKTVSRVVN